MLGQPVDMGRQRGQQKPVDLRVPGSKLLEFIPPNHDRFAGLYRRNGRGPARMAVDQSELPEDLPGTENSENRLVALRVSTRTATRPVASR